MMQFHIGIKPIKVEYGARISLRMMQFHIGIKQVSYKEHEVNSLRMMQFHIGIKLRGYVEKRNMVFENDVVSYRY